MFLRKLHFFHRSIAENIAYGKPDATQAEIEQTAKLANAHEFIIDMPEGYETLVGERGVKLLVAKGRELRLLARF